MEDCKVGLTSKAKLDLWLNKSWSWGACYLPDYLAALLNFTPQLLVVQAVTKLFQAFLNVFTGASLPLIDSQCSNNTVKRQISNLCLQMHESHFILTLKYLLMTFRRIPICFFLMRVQFILLYQPQMIENLSSIWISIHIQSKSIQNYSPE